MARTHHLWQSDTYTNLMNNIQVIDTGVMGGCITAVVVSSTNLRAQHCAGGYQALQAGFWNIGGAHRVGVIIGIPTGNDQGRINADLVGAGIPRMAHLLYSHALVHVPLLRTSNTNHEITMSVVQR